MHRKRNQIADWKTKRFEKLKVLELSFGVDRGNSRKLETWERVFEKMTDSCETVMSLGQIDKRERWQEEKEMGWTGAKRFAFLGLTKAFQSSLGRLQIPEYLTLLYASPGWPCCRLDSSFALSSEVSKFTVFCLIAVRSSWKVIGVLIENGKKRFSDLLIVQLRFLTLGFFFDPQFFEVWTKSNYTNCHINCFGPLVLNFAWNIWTNSGPKS